MHSLKISNNLSFVSRMTKRLDEISNLWMQKWQLSVRLNFTIVGF